MNTAETERVLRENVGRAVRVTVNSPEGHSAIWAVENVDQEGFSYTIIEDSDWERGEKCWSEYGELASVEPWDSDAN